MMQRFICFLLALLLPAIAQSDDFIEWHSSNIQFLKGWDYEVGEEERALITLEHANSWRYGDFFAFVDGTRYDDGGTKAYTEISPRFSLSKMVGKPLNKGLVKDVLVSTTYERAKGNRRVYLYGGAVDLNVPGFAFFKTNLYVRDNPHLDSDTWQVTLSWKRPFSMKGQQFVTEGFADFAGNAGNAYHANQYIVPRLLMDISRIIGQQKGRAWFGVEYSYWRNKFGIDGKTESLPQLQFKWVF